MYRLQLIEHKLTSINQAAFQNLCDKFLVLRHRSYSTISRIGSQLGKQKTVKGTPDTALLLTNGKYIFVEYSTNISAGVSKLEVDIKKCIDTTKTGIPIEEISEIILCINFNLTTVESRTLKSLLINTDISLTVYTLDALAIELYLNHRDLVHEYLGLPLDTGQIVSLEKFIEEYSRASKGIATPLNNTFLHRVQELQILKENIIQNDFIILTGAPGIGKTRLALEGIRSFLSENLSYTAYCVSYKHYTLLDDLFQYFNTEKNYILFVDDANRIDTFNQIVGFYKATRKGSLKIIITVRDYAFPDIEILCQEFLPQRIDLKKFTDEQIRDIIMAKPFNIFNTTYRNKIVRIADGNPRLAIMAALLANAKQSIYALYDVSDLFQNYFTTFIADNEEFAKKINIKCLGLISFFHTIPYKNKEIANSILDSFELEYSEFIEAIDKLDKLELVDIQFEHVKVTEQNLSTFFFYKAFIEDNLLSFETLLNKYFKNNSDKFKDSVIPANNMFGHSNVMDKLKPFLVNYWKTNRNNKDKIYKFLAVFWFYLPDETLEFIYEHIQTLPKRHTNTFKISYEKDAFSSDRDKIIELIGELFRFHHKLQDALSLAFDYTRKAPEKLSDLIHKIQKQITFEEEDEQNNFRRQTILFQLLIDGLNKKDILLSTVFYELAKTFLDFSFHHFKSAGRKSFYQHNYIVPNTTIIQSFRNNIWDAIQTNFQVYPNKSFELLQNYSRINPLNSKEIMQYDIPMLVNIIKKQLTPNSFEHCKYVQELVELCKTNSVSHSSFPELQKKFVNSTYKTYLIVDWEKYHGKEMYKFNNRKEYEKLKEAEIRNSFIFKNRDEIINFYKTFVYLKNNTEKNWYYNRSIDFIIDENYTRSFQVGCELLQIIIKNDNEVEYIPEVFFSNQLKKRKNADIIWNIIEENDFFRKPLWELSFYVFLDNSLLNIVDIKSLINTIRCMNNIEIIRFYNLKKFLVFKPDLFQIILKIIVDKYEKEGIKIRICEDTFSEYFDLLGTDILLIKKAYIQQVKIYNYFDYEGKGMLNILKKNSNFLIEYTKSLYDVKQFSVFDKSKRLEYIWQVEEIEKTLITVFDFMSEKEPYLGLGEHSGNAFFQNLQGEQKEKASKFLLNYVKTNFKNPKKMSIVINIATKSMVELLDEIILLFLSLTQDKNIFAKIIWSGGPSVYVGDVNIWDIRAANWRNILSIVEKSRMGISLIPIKQFINNEIEYSLELADKERKRKFLEGD